MQHSSYLGCPLKFCIHGHFLVCLRSLTFILESRVNMLFESCICKIVLIARNSFYHYVVHTLCMRLFRNQNKIALILNKQKDAHILCDWVIMVQKPKTTQLFFSIVRTFWKQISSTFQSMDACQCRFFRQNKIGFTWMERCSIEHTFTIFR